MINLTTPEGVEMYMTLAISESDWNKRCDDVKEANGGDYPGFWFMVILASGLARRIAESWGDDDEHDSQ